MSVSDPSAEATRLEEALANTRFRPSALTTGPPDPLPANSPEELRCSFDTVLRRRSFTNTSGDVFSSLPKLIQLPAKPTNRPSADTVAAEEFVGEPSAPTLETWVKGVSASFPTSRSSPLPPRR